MLKYIKRKISKNYNEYTDIIKNVKISKNQKSENFNSNFNNNQNKIEKTYNCIFRSLEDISSKQKKIEEKIFNLNKKNEIMETEDKSFLKDVISDNS